MKKRVRNAIAGILACCAAAPSLATDYYVSDCQAGADAQCVAGDDGAANPGTNPATPWRTFNRATAQFENDASFFAGDRVLFARGGSWVVGARRDLTNMNCQTGAACVIGAYTPPWASGDEGRPILTNLTGGIFTFANGGNSNMDGNYELRGLELRGGGGGTNPEEGIFIFNDVNDLVITDMVIDGFRIGVHSAGANPVNPPSNGANDRIVLRDSRIINNSSQGWLGGSLAGLIENNDFENNGFGVAVLDHNIYLSLNNSDAVVRNNRLYRASFIGGKCMAVSLVAHGVGLRMLIEGNVIREDVGAADYGCWGIALDGGGQSYREEFGGTIIRGNTVVNVGNMSIGVTSCPDCVIENNVIINEQAFGVRGIAVPDKDRAPVDAADDNVTIRNNSIYIGAAATGSTGIRLGFEGTSHAVVNNVIQHAGTSSSWNCLDLDQPASSYETVDNNICHFSNAPLGEWENGSGSLAAWRAATGFDVVSIMADPQFASIADPWDLSIPGVSPAVGFANPAWSSALDILGLARDAAPDAGAFEFGGAADSMPPARPRNLRVR